MRRVSIAAAALFAFAAVASPAAAADWELKFSPYIWASGLDGEIGVFPRLPPVSVDASFDDILKNLQFAAMGTIEARTGKFGILTDFIYVDADVSRSATIADRAFISVNLKSKTVMTTFATLWRFVEQPRLDVDLLVGTQLIWTETALTLRRDDGVVFSSDPDKMWMDPIAGARGAYTLSPRWSLTALGDLGAGASELTWQVYAAANYKVNDTVRLEAGWRHFEVDFEEDAFVYDVTQDGPLLGATFTF